MIRAMVCAFYFGEYLLLVDHRLGGAKWIEGWKSFFMIEWFALDWTAEQIRLYVLIIWLFSVIWFIVGAIKPELRFY